MRIARALALAGVDSRRKCETYVQNGEVFLNGKVVRDLGRQVDIECDQIVFREKKLDFQKSVYFMLNKPKSYMVTSKDPYAKKTVYSLLPSTLGTSTQQYKGKRIRVFAVGRLDRDTTGLLLFTNDGDLAHRLLHPKYKIEKWYYVKLSRPFESAHKKRLIEGIELEEGKAKVEEIKMLSAKTLHLKISEGKKREIKRLFAKLDYRVMELHRFIFGPLVLGNLPVGEGRFLSEKEIGLLKKVVSDSKKC